MTYFFVLAELAFCFWYITAPTFACVIGATGYTFKKDPGFINAKTVGGLAVLFVFPLIILVLGEQYKAPPGSGGFLGPTNPHAKAGYSLVNAVMFFQLLVGLFLLWQLQRCVWVVLAVFVFTLELSMAASFLSRMAISGNWL